MIKESGQRRLREASNRAGWTLAVLLLIAFVGCALLGVASLLFPLLAVLGGTIDH
ncbi:hypothetical protein SUDANB96_03314 [Streptomyces sp. enrichment culture]